MFEEYYLRDEPDNLPSSANVRWEWELLFK